jgi:polysaccharide biosynthesis PFTS motif protein
MKINLYKKFYNQLKGLKKIRKNKKYFKVINVVNTMFNENIDLDIKKPLFFPKKYINLIHHLVHQNLMHLAPNIILDFFEFYGNDKKLKSYIPIEYAKFLKDKYDISSSKFFNKLNLLKLSFIYLLKSIKLILNLILNRNKIKHDVIFFNTPEECYNHNDINSYNLINWYKNNISSSKNEKILIQNNLVKKDIDYTEISIHKFVNFGGLDIYSKCKFLSSILLPLISSFFSIIFLKWWNLILFYEIIYLNYIKCIPKKVLPKKFIFNNSLWYYKPLFVSYLENLDSNSVYLLFYSANMENFQYRNFKKEEHYGINQINYVNILVWDKYQKKYLENYNKKSNIQICNNIDFIEKKSDLEIINPNNLKIISIFDIHPSENILINMSNGYDIPPYYSNKICLKFLEDIGIANKNRFLLIYKSKRIDLKKTNSNQFNIDKQKIIDEYYHEVHPEISPRRIIDKSDATISSPFTSTALLSKYQGKPTVFYDSLDLLKNSQFHEIDVLKKIEDLKKWINKLN